MKHIKLFETWNDNIIDKSLFISGRAKYNPKVSNDVIHYKTDKSEKEYTAEITKKGGKFICKVYKIKKDGEKKRIKNKIKNTLKTAHNYVREYLNQRLKNKPKKKEKKQDLDLMKIEEPQVQPMIPPMMPMEELKSKTIIRRFY
jgi:RecG-like helicase